MSWAFRSRSISAGIRRGRKAGWADGVSLEHAAFGSVLGSDGKLFRGRDGTGVKLKALLDEAEQRAYALVSEKNPESPEQQRRDIARAVGIGAVKYADLSKDRTSDYVFAWTGCSHSMVIPPLIFRMHMFACRGSSAKHRPWV